MSAVELLSERDDLDSVRTAWLPGVDQTEIVKDSAAHHMLQIRRGMGGGQFSAGELERGLRGLIRAELGRESTTDRFNLLHIQLIRLLNEMLELADASELEYLAASSTWAVNRPCASRRSYDLTVESACDIRACLGRGWTRGTHSGTWSGPTGVKLLKLHGSINWDRVSSVLKERTRTSTCLE